MTSSQPLCIRCWLRNSSSYPVRAPADHPRICCRCGAATTSGLTIRIDPASVPYPSED